MDRHATPQDRLRFQIETEAVARLQHPHIVQLYEVGEVRGQPFFSLESCDGGTLPRRHGWPWSSVASKAGAVSPTLEVHGFLIRHAVPVCVLDAAGNGLGGRAVPGNADAINQVVRRNDAALDHRHRTLGQ